MAAREVAAVVATVLLIATGPLTPTAAGGDPLQAMSAVAVVPPAPAPDVVFQTLDGQPARLDGLRGQPVLLTFFTTW